MPEARRGGDVSEKRARESVASRRASSTWPVLRQNEVRTHARTHARCCVINADTHTHVRTENNKRPSRARFLSSARRNRVGFRIAMADFDAIYEEEEENEQNLEEHYVAMVPDPIVIRGAGNMTV